MKQKWIIYLLLLALCLGLAPAALADGEAGGSGTVEWEKSNDPLVLAFDAPVEAVSINGMTLSDAYYALSDDGTVVSLPADILNGWQNGTYRFTVTAGDAHAFDVHIFGTAPTEQPDPDEEPAEHAEAVDNGVCGDDLTWRLTYDGVLTISGSGDMWDYRDDYDCWWADLYTINGVQITILETVIEPGVTSIGARAFNASDMTKVTIPGTVTVIGERAFSSCYLLSEVELPEGVTTIEARAFEPVEVVSLPSTLESVGDYAFSEYSLREATYAGTPEQLDKVSFGEGNTALLRLLSGHSNDDCGDDLSWSISDGVLTVFGTGDMWDYDGSTAPWYMSDEAYTSIVIDEGVTGIGASAFSYSEDLASIRFPVSLERIGRSNFEVLDGSTAILYDGTDEQRDAIELGAGCYGLQIAWFGYASGQAGENVTWRYTPKTGTLSFAGSGDMYDNVHVFYELLGYEYANFSTYLYSVPWGETTGYASSSRNVVIGDGVTSIMPLAFSDSQITEVTIPAGITHIGDYAFSGCESLKSITFEGDAPVFDILLVTLSEDSGFVHASEQSSAFDGVTATAYYPAGNPTWTEAVRRSCGGNITWVAYDPAEQTVTADTAAGYLREPGKAYRAAQTLQQLVRG